MFKDSRGGPRPVGRETRRAAGFDWLCHVDAPVLCRTMGWQLSMVSNPESAFWLIPIWSDYDDSAQNRRDLMKGDCPICSAPSFSPYRSWT